MDGSSHVVVRSRVVVVSSIEGALMLGQLYGDPAPMSAVADHLESYVSSLEVV